MAEPSREGMSARLWTTSAHLEGITGRLHGRSVEVAGEIRTEARPGLVVSLRNRQPAHNLLQFAALRVPEDQAVASAAAREDTSEGRKRNRVHRNLMAFERSLQLARFDIPDVDGLVVAPTRENLP